MNDPLEDFFNAPDAPAQDPVFRLAVAERIARRRLLIRVGGLAAGFALTSFCLAAAWSMIAASLHAVADAATLTMTVFLIIATGTYAVNWWRRRGRLSIFFR